MDDWTNIVLLFITLVISLTFHEAAHATFALLGGDRTAYYSGQVTLNPLPHIRREPFGTVVFPLLALFMSQGTMIIGYASTPIDPVWARRHPGRAALMSAAGPLANTVLAAVAFGVLCFVHRGSSHNGDTVWLIAVTFLSLNILLAVFNLIPLPPLDGAGVVAGLVPASNRFYDSLKRQPYAGLIVLVLVIKVIPMIYEPVFYKVMSWLPH